MKEFGRRVSERWHYFSSVALLASAFLGLTSHVEASPANTYLVPNIFEGQVYTLTLPNGQGIQLNKATYVGSVYGRNLFDSSPWNYLGYKYITPQNTYDTEIIADKGTVLWIDIHSGGARKQLPGDQIIKYETSFYNNPDIYIGWQHMEVEDIQVVYVKDVLEKEPSYTDRLLTAADDMDGHVFIQTCYPPYYVDNAGDYVGANVLLIGADMR